MQEEISKLKNLHLLFVEDETHLLNIITDTMTKLNANFYTAANGKEAIDVLQKHPIHIVITDLNMPIMDGFGLIEFIKQTHPMIQVITMSAHTEESSVNKAQQLGVHHYLIKPFDFVKFIHVIAQLKVS